MHPTIQLLRRFAPIAIVGILAAACGGGGPPLQSLAPVPGDTIRLLHPGDVIQVKVFGHDELSGDFPIDENDSLLLPIVGGFSVKDMSVTDIRGRIRREFGQLYTQSFVSVTPLFRVAVVGEVVHPGLYSVEPTMTIVQILAQAGGTTRQAKESAMRLVRNGQLLRISLDPTALASSTIREVGVRSGDQIVVPRKSVTYETWVVVLQGVAVLLSAYTAIRVR
jgi:protein involved in polysaccharide export with SLBB domain